MVISLGFGYNKIYFVFYLFTLAYSLHIIINLLSHYAKGILLYIILKSFIKLLLNLKTI